MAWSLDGSSALDVILSKTTTWPAPGKSWPWVLPWASVKGGHLAFPPLTDRLETESLKRVPVGGVVQIYLALPFGVSQLIIYRMEFLVGTLWYVPLIPALKRLRQEDCHNF